MVGSRLTRNSNLLVGSTTGGRRKAKLNESSLRKRNRGSWYVNVRNWLIYSHLTRIYDML